MAQTRTEIPDWILADRELGPGVLLLTSSLVADKTARFLDLRSADRNRVVRWDRLADAGKFWSTGERIYLELALHFWTGNELPFFAQPYRWGATLSRSNRGPILEAVALALGEQLPEQA